MLTIVFFKSKNKKSLKFFFFPFNIRKKNEFKGDKMPTDMMLIFQTYLPELLGALFVGNALFFFGQNDKLEKNNLVFAALAFMALAFKDLFNVIMLMEFVEPIQTSIPNNLMASVDAAAISLASMLMIVGGFEYSKTLAWVKKPIVVFVFMLIWYFITYITLLPFISANLLLNIYLSVGLVVLGLFFCLARFNSNAYNLRFPGLLILGLSVYYMMISIKRQSSWILETAIYVLIVWGIYRTTTRQLRKETQELAKELKQTKAKIPMIIQSSPYPIIISALKDDRLLLVNEKAAALFNIDMHNIKQFRTEEYFVDANARKELLQKLSISPVVENYQAIFRKPNTNEAFWLEISARVMDYENEVALYSAFKDITAQKKHEQALFEKAVLDPLTGCYNRRQFQELAMKEIRRAWRYDSQFCLMMMDIDHFKRVNDTYGHAFGDEVLKMMARVCKQTLRETDIFARFGGEEFIVLLTNTDLAGGTIVAERVRQNIEQCGVTLSTGDIFHFTVSVGVVGSNASDDLDELIKRADSALYMAKENGRNQVRVFGEKESFEKVKNEALNEQTSESFSKKIIDQANEIKNQDN